MHGARVIEVKYTPRIDVTNLSHRFAPDGDWVLRDVNASFLADGASVAIVAPSGSGKTTLLGLLGGLLVPTEGTIERSGSPETRGWRAHGCAFVFQTTNSLGRRTALDNVALARMAVGDSDPDARLAALGALDRLGLAPVAERKARLLSGGELQRVAIARAIVSDQPFVLADEPTGQLDSETTELVAAALFEITADSNRSLIVATHDPVIAQSCGTILHLRNGALSST